MRQTTAHCPGFPGKVASTDPIGRSISRGCGSVWDSVDRLFRSIDTLTALKIKETQLHKTILILESRSSVRKRNGMDEIIIGKI